MEQRLFDCLNDAYKFSLNDPAYMHLIEDNFDRVSESLDSTKKVVYENLTLTPGRGVGIDLEIKNNNVSYHFVVLAQMKIEYDPDTYGDNIFYLCATYSHEDRYCSPFWVCDCSYFFPYGRIYDKAAAVTLYSALATAEHNYTDWITNCLDDKMKSYTLFLMI